MYTLYVDVHENEHKVSRNFLVFIKKNSKRHVSLFVVINSHFFLTKIIQGSLIVELTVTY